MADTATESAEERLAAIEARVAALEPPAALMQAIEDASDIGSGPASTAARYHLARGIVQNRNGMPATAELSLERARSLATAADAMALSAVVSRELARVHTWRGDAKSSALELLRSMIEADAAGSAADKAMAVAEFGRLNLESGRYEAALVFLDRATAQSDLLPPRELSRLAINRREALAALGQWDACLDGIDALIAGIRPEFRRDGFVARLLKARSLEALHRHGEAVAAAEEAELRMSSDPQSFEQAELALMEGCLAYRSEPKDAVPLLEQALERFVDDDLPRHEFDARILLAETLAALGRQGEAETCVAEALQRAEARELPAMADHVRASAFGFWKPENIAELAGDSAAVPGNKDRRARFLIIETLGEGGFGSVQRAIDAATGIEVAIKRLRRDPEASAAAGRMAVNTVRNEILAAAALLPGRAIARTRYLHVDDDGIVLVQDFVAGPTLRHSLVEESLTTARCYAVAAGVARAVAVLHAANLAHRDLKPENIILRNGTQPVLIDLGLARLKGIVDLTARAGTQGYAPKEQWQGGSDERWLGREDLYALGKIIEEMLGEAEPPPGARRGLFGIGRRKAESGTLSGQLGASVRTMLADDPAARNVDLAALAVLLDQAARDAEIAESREE